MAQRKPGRPATSPRKKTSGKSSNSSQGASRGNLSDYRPKSQSPLKRNPKSKQQITENRKVGFSGGKRPYDYAFYEKEEATPEYMARLFAQREYKVSDRELEAYWKYYCLLRTHNAELDLTRIMGIEATVLKHFIDCSIVADLTELKGPILDIGSGPGFPGAPIAIRRPDIPVILAESRGKRVRFLEMVRSELGLKNVEIYPKSVREDSALEACSIVTRAVEVIPATLKRVAPFLQSNGRVVFMKGPGCGQEITEAQQNFKGAYKMVEDIRYDLPNTNQNRRLVVFEKR